ncbi:MAG: FAD-binding protein [Deltaproteobacteria bacterium]|nr:FAD-binding protein [Deltaproteobacteria bacterium]
MKIENLVETDVLVIGGGMAGSFAAIKAREKGVDVAIVDKGYAGKSGSSPYAFWYVVYNPEWGHDLKPWMDYVNSLGEYLNNRGYTERVFKESYDRYQDMVSYGVEFMLGEDGKPKGYTFPGIPTESFQLKKRVFGQVLRKKAKELGVKIFDRIMLTDLIKKDGKIAGAAGFAMESNEFHVFKAKTVVMCSGGAAFKPDGWPVSELTGDGDAMAYRIGAEIAGKEFNEPKSTGAEMPAPTMGMFLWEKEESNRAPEKSFGPPQVHELKCVNALGEDVMGIAGANFINMEFEVHAGRLPVYSKTEQLELVPRVGNATAGMSLHTAEGLWPLDYRGKTSIPGLYAAGDSCSTMQVGATYPGVGYALAGASVTGARAGAAAAEYAMTCESSDLDVEEVLKMKEKRLAPLERKGGFSPRWVTQMLRNTLIPYYMLYIKHEDRLKAALTLVEFMRDHFVPKLTAKDAHDLRLAVETENMVLNAEMKLRASLFREESRGTHYREDIPRRVDPDWLAWVTMKDVDGKMTLSKKPIPEEWRPDLTKPYDEIYVNEIPKTFT